jgi:LPXTG-site transpeptidase (sortase) family protein
MRTMHEFFEQIWSQKLAFLGTFFMVFTLTYIVLVAVDFLPEKPAEESTDFVQEINEEDVAIETNTLTEDSVVGEGDIKELVFPVSISIKKLDKTITVLNPESREINDLDTALLSGAVRHPDSAGLGQEGNILIMAHSSYLPNVINKNFQAFNGIQDLAWGDMIEVSSESEIYKYRVEKVYRAKAEEVIVPIAGTENLLTLATCNSFGSKDDRYIVEAKQIEVQSL